MKIRVAKKATKGKKVRWRKGESSSLNALSKKFRSKVNLLSVNQYNENEDLNFASLSNHGNNALNQMESDCDNMSTGTVNSFASVYTDCSNISFSKLMNDWNSGSLLHREMVAILATATETIRENNGKETETEYFAIFMTILERTEKEETLVAILSLIFMVIKNVPSSVLKLKFSETSNVFIKLLGEYYESNNGYLLMNLIRSLAHLLKCQEKAIWHLSSTHQMFDLILTFTLHPKPRVRKTAHRSIVSIIRGSDIVWQTQPQHHLAAPFAAKFCMSKIVETSINDNFNQVLHMLNLLKDIISVLPFTFLKPCCETLLRVCSLKNMLAIHCCFQIFSSLFSQKNPLRDLNHELTASLIRALYDYQPSMSDSESLSLWITVIQQAHLALYSMKKELCLKMISDLVISFTACFQSESIIVYNSASQSLKRIIEDIIADSLDDTPPEIMMNIIETFENCLSFKYQNARSSICSVISTIFQKIGAKKPHLVKNLIKLLANLREGYNSQFFVDIDQALASAVKFVGPQHIIEAIPLEINLVQNDFGFSWLIPIFRANIAKTQLSFFVDYFIPLSDKVEKIIKELEEQDSQVEVKLYQVLNNQIWSLLPSFCNQPSDLTKAFTPEFAKILGAKIEHSEQIKIECLASLRALIKKCVLPEEKAVLSRFAKNYLPILFNVYTNPKSSENTGKELAVFETIKVYLDITNDELIKSNYNKVMSKLINYDGDKQLRHLLLDLLRLFVPFLGLAELQCVYETIVISSIEDNEDARRQKKGYRLLEEMCKIELAGQLLENMDQNIIDFLLHCLAKCVNQAKSSPLRALNFIIDKKLFNVKSQLLQKFNQIIIIIIDCLVLNSARVKKGSLQLLSTVTLSVDNGHNIILNRLTELYHESELSRKPALLKALSYLMVTFQEKFGPEVKSLFLDRILELLQSDSRPIVKTAFAILKVWLKTISDEEVFHCLHSVISNVTSINESNRSILRLEIKQLITRLIRKFGYDVILINTTFQYN